MTLSEPSHSHAARSWPQVRCAPMIYTVLLRTSPAGAAVHVLREGDVLDGGDGVRYRLVCSTDDAEEAERAASIARERLGQRKD